MYVPDDKMLGNPGVIGFIKGAIQTVGDVLTGKRTVTLPKLPTSVQPQIIVQAPPNVQLPAVPPWLLPVGLGVVALVVLPRLMGGRR